MTTTPVKATVLSVVLLALAMALLWQRARINRLGMEAADLRAQLSKAVAVAGEDRQSANLQPRTDQPFAQEKFGELLRLRGEVGVLRRQLAEALRVTPSWQNLPTPEQPLHGEKSGLAALEAKLTEQQGNLDAAKQKAEQLFTELNVPEDVAKMDGDDVANLSSESLEHCMPYFQAKGRLEELERFTAVLKIKMNAERNDAQEDVLRSSSP